MIALEHRVGEDRTLSQQARGETLLDCRIEHFKIEFVVMVAREHAPQRAHRGAIDGFIEGDAEVIRIDHAQVDAGFARACGQRVCAIRHLHGQRVKVSFGQDGIPQAM